MTRQSIAVAEAYDLAYQISLFTRLSALAQKDRPFEATKAG